MKLISSTEEIQSIKVDIEKILSVLESVRQRLAQMAGEPIAPILKPPEWGEQRLRLWAKVYDAGGIIDQATLHKFAKETGYDPRGLAGFFKGKGSFVWVGRTDDRKVALSPWASEEVERYRDWLDQQKK